jgi:hypothetical protein
MESPGDILARLTLAKELKVLVFFIRTLPELLGIFGGNNR